MLGQQHPVAGDRETIRRGVHREDRGWRRPRPVVGRRDPDREAKRRGRRRDLPANEAVVLEGAADVGRNPKLGGMGMPKGRPAEVVTPGGNASATWPGR